jgi:hypothetical protein
MQCKRKKQLSSYLMITKHLKEKIGTLKVTDPTETEDGAKQTWEIFNFYHLPLAGVVTNLSQMQSDIEER